MFIKLRVGSLKTLAAALALFCANNAEASNLVFQGQNAALFPNANPADTAALMNSVHKPEKPTETPTISPSSLIQQSVLSQISSKIYNEIFTGTAESGFYNLGDGSTISYLRSGGYVTITISNAGNGSTTITVPTV